MHPKLCAGSAAARMRFRRTPPFEASRRLHIGSPTARQQRAVARHAALTLRRRQTTTPTPDATSPTAFDGPRGPIRIAMALLAIGVIAFTVTSVLDPNASHAPFFARILVHSVEPVGSRADCPSRLPRHGRPVGLGSDRGRHGVLGDRRRGLRPVGAGRSVPVAGRPGVPGVLPVRLCRAAAAHAGTPEVGADFDPARSAGLRVGHGRGGRGADGRAPSTRPRLAHRQPFWSA